MKHLIVVLALTNASAFAQTPVEFSLKMQNNIRDNWFQKTNNHAEYRGTLYAEVQTVPCPDTTCVVIRKSSGNKEFDAELIRAGTQALNGVQSGVIVPVEYKPFNIPLDLYFPELDTTLERF